MYPNYKALLLDCVYSFIEVAPDIGVKRAIFSLKKAGDDLFIDYQLPGIEVNAASSKQRKENGAKDVNLRLCEVTSNIN
jgi:hypothetical protein